MMHGQANIKFVIGSLSPPLPKLTSAKRHNPENQNVNSHHRNTSNSHRSSRLVSFPQRPGLKDGSLNGVPLVSLPAT